jgi:hypothetical protein
MRGGRALRDFDDGAFDLIACTDAHDGSFMVSSRAWRRPASTNRGGGESVALIRSLAGAYGAAMPNNSAVSP